MMCPTDTGHSCVPQAQDADVSHRHRTEVCPTGTGVFQDRGVLGQKCFRTEVFQDRGVSHRHRTEVF